METVITHDRLNTPMTNEHFAAFCKKMLGQPYWYGCCLYKCSSGLLTKKARQYPKAYTKTRMAKYRQNINDHEVCADCIGAAKGYTWTNGGIGVVESIGNNLTYTSKYASNNCPDKGANSMFSYIKRHGLLWGKIDTLPELVGLALYKSGHAGYYVGGGFAVEWKGFADGCVKTVVADRGWTHWYRLPFLDYGDGVKESGSLGSPQVENLTIDFGTRLLRYQSGKEMMKGNDVLAVQKTLLAMGFDPGLPDGIYGPKTVVAVKCFQATHGITSDGVVGPITRRFLMQYTVMNEPYGN